MPEERSSSSWCTLFYNAKTGVGSVVRFDDAGNANTAKTYTSFSPGWTSISQMPQGLLFTDSAGKTVLGEIDSGGNFRTK